MVASSNFKAAGFTEAVMQMNFWITHGLAHLNTLSSNWHFCVYFRQAQAFRCITTASLTLDILYFFWQRRIQISWYLDHPIFFCANLYSNNHRITSILLSLRYIDLLKVEIDLCHVTKTKWLMCHVNLWVGFSYPLSLMFGVHTPCESGKITFFICHVTTTSKSCVTFWLGFSHSKSSPY